MQKPLAGCDVKVTLDSKANTMSMAVNAEMMWKFQAFLRMEARSKENEQKKESLEEEEEDEDFNTPSKTKKKKKKASYQKMWDAECIIVHTYICIYTFGL